MTRDPNRPRLDISGSIVAVPTTPEGWAELSACAAAILAERDAARGNGKGPTSPGVHSEHQANNPPPEDDAPARFKRWSVAELLAADLTFRWDMVGQLVRPTYGADTGELKSMKSTFGIARLVALASGLPMLGQWAVPERRRVLVYVAEGGRIPFTRRLGRVCEAHGIEVGDLDGWLTAIFDAAPLDSVRFRDDFRQHIDEFDPKFVHLDPLYPFQPATVDSNRLAQMGAMLSEVEGVCSARGATFWITAHMNQTGTGFDLKRIAGAGTAEWADSWTLLRHRLPPDVPAGRFKLTAEIGSRQWGGASWEVDLNIGRFDPESGMHDGPFTYRVAPSGSTPTEDTAAGRDAEMAVSILAAIRKATKGRGAEPMTRDEIVERVGANRALTVKVIAQMVDDGRLIKTNVPYLDTSKRTRQRPVFTVHEGLE